jgi:hypothetical protein
MTLLDQRAHRGRGDVDPVVPHHQVEARGVTAPHFEPIERRQRDLHRGHRLDRGATRVSSGEVAYEISQGPVISLPHDPQLIELCEALSAAGQSARPIRHPVLDDAMPARVRRLRAITLRTTDSDGNLAPWYHTHEDVPEQVDAEALTRATDFVVSLARLLDREASRAAAPQPTPERTPV